MGDCFGIVNFLQDEKAFKFEFLNNSPKFLRHYLLKKFDKVNVEEISICGVNGYNIKIPLTYEEFLQNKELSKTLLENTLNCLSKERLVSVYCDKNIPFDISLNIYTCKGKKIAYFLALQLIDKLLHLVSKSRKDVNILILDEDENITFTLIDVIYENINNLVINSIKCENSTYLEKCTEVFEDCGLVIKTTNKNYNLIKEADIVLNTDCEHNLDYFFKENCAYFDMTSNFVRCSELKQKRTDLSIFNNVTLFSDGKNIDASLFETIFYAYSRSFRKYCDGVFHKVSVSEILDDLKKLNILISVVNFKPSL